MPIEVTDLDSLDTAEVDDALTRARELIVEKYPDRQVRGGPFEDLVLRSDAMLGTVHRTNFDRLRASQSLKAIEEDPTLTDDEVLDSLASNYRIERLEGATSFGDITIIVSAATDTIIAAGSEFTAPNGQVFASDDLYTGRVNQADVLTDNDRIMTALDDSTYAFTIAATALEEGVAGNVQAFSTLTMEAPPANFVRAYTGSTFSGGQDPESTASLQARLQTGPAHRSLCSRPAIEGVIRNDEDFADIVAASVVGYGDPEQLRYHSLFPIAFGGRVDAYIRTENLPDTVELTKTATLVAADGTWQLSFGRDEAPAFYEVSKILLPTQATDATGFAVTEDIRGADTTAAPADTATPGTSFIPDIEDAEEGVYSRYQTASIKFLDTTTDVSGLTVGSSTASYRVFLKVMPSIDEVQDLIAVRTVRSPAGDCLVKAPVPCFTEASLSINKKSGDPDLDTGLIQQAVIEAVNQSGFTGKLAAAKIASAAEESLVSQGATGASVAEVVLTGRIRRPDGTTNIVTSSTVLDVGDEPNKMVTGRTVVFISELGDVAVTVATVGIPEV